MNNKAAVINDERRQSERRMFRNLSRFPPHTPRDELVLFERRQIPCRRLNNIAVRETACLDYVAAVIRSHI
jgi:hypothetical protein